MAKTVLALGSLLPAEMEVLESRFQVIRLWEESDPDGALQRYRTGIAGIVSTYATPVSRRLMEALPNLEIVAQFGVGVDNIDLAAAREMEIAVTNTPDVLTDDTADVALALILAVARRVVEGDMFVRVGKWKGGALPLGTSLAGKVAGIVGMGRIGQAVARRCAAFGMDIVYCGPREKAGLPYRYVAEPVKLAELCDFMVLSCRGGEDTENLVDYRVLEALGPAGFLINVARGSVVNEQDLLIALRNGVIRGAGLDVYRDEPRVPEALFSMDNVVLLPHIGSATMETRGAMGRMVIENLLAHFGGRPLKTPVGAEGPPAR